MLQFCMNEAHAVGLAALKLKAQENNANMGLALLAPHYERLEALRQGAKVNAEKKLWLRWICTLRLLW